ncbi:MAG: MFS transporter, partial [Actinomycetes bacterium]
ELAALLARAPPELIAAMGRDLAAVVGSRGTVDGSTTDLGAAVVAVLKTAVRGKGTAKKDTFAAFKVRNFRLYAVGALISSFGTWMQYAAQDWMVLTLTNHSGTWLSVVTLLQFVPTILLSIPAGVLADRFDKRRMAMISSVVSGLAALVLGVVGLVGSVELWLVLTVTGVLGVTSALDRPIRDALLPEMVGDDLRQNAVALKSAMINVARIAGPAIAGVLIALVGTGWLFAANGVSYGAALLALVLMNPATLLKSMPVAKEKGLVRAGLKYVWEQKLLRYTIALIFMVSTWGINSVLTVPLLVTQVFGSGSDGIGLLHTALAVGAVGGSLMVARRSTVASMAIVLGGALLFGIAQTVSGLMPTLALAAALMVPTGLFEIAFITFAKAKVQAGAERDMTGRVMGVFTLAYAGGSVISAPVLGWVGDAFGGRAPTLVAGIVTVVSTLALAPVLLRLAAGKQQADGRIAPKLRRAFGTMTIGRIGLVLVLAGTAMLLT